MSNLTDRMLRAAKLDVDLYEEVEADASATGQAAIVIVLSSLAAGIGAMGQTGATGMIIATVAALLGWYIWALLTWLIGTKLLPEEQTEADVGQLLRTIGFSSAPGLLRIFGIIPGIGALVAFAASIWMLVAMVIAVRQALDYTSTFRAVGVVVVGFIVQILVMAVVMSLMGMDVETGA